MVLIHWPDLLQGISDLVLSDPENAWIGPEVRARGTLGFPGADEADIAAAEARLGTRFPPSYREFLKASNGWEAMGAAAPGKLWSTTEIEWLSVRNQELIEDAGTFECGPEMHLAQQLRDPCWYHGPYMERALEISDWGDACILFLCPDVVTPEGEWECWEYASWHPGAHRYPSFGHWFLSPSFSRWYFAQIRTGEC